MNPLIAPTQDKLSVSDYFTIFNFYAVGVGKDLDDPDIRVKFMAHFEEGGAFDCIKGITEIKLDDGII